jgi:predicted DNA-binding transcriptional regulator AlpA
MAALEKIPHAAKRMGVSTATLYRELKSGRLVGPLVKVGERASAIPSASVLAWIADRIAEATKNQGGDHD